MKNIYFVILSLIVIAYIIVSIRRNKLSVGTSFGWIIFCLIMLVLSIWPKSLDWLARALGITYPPALFLTLCIVLLLIIDFSYSKKLEELKLKVTDLAQELSILKEEQNEKSERK